MSLTIAFKLAQKGLALTESKLAVVSSNINNANTVGYTRKAYQSTYVTSESVTSPLGGTIIQATIDAALSKKLNSQGTTYYYDKTIASYMSDYSDAFGSTSDSSSTLSSTVDSLTASLQALEENPTQVANKASVINTAQQVASQLNSLSQTIQNERQEASTAIAASVQTINDQLTKLATLNRQVVEAMATGDNAAELVDQRNAAIQTLSQQMGIQYFTDDNSQLKVYTTSGDLLLSGTYSATFDYTQPSTVTSSTAYPGGISGVTLNGTDVTTSLKTGALGALITLRDTTLPGEQAKLDQLATTLAEVTNATLSAGASIPPPSSITGTTVTSSSAALSATGTWRVAVTNSSGVVQSYADLNLSTYATVGDLITGLNSISGVSASINSSGQLTISSSASGTGISMNEMTSAIGGKGASNYFGLNSLFQGTNGNAITASNIKINEALNANNSTLPTGTLSASSTLAAGDQGVSSGDITAVTALINTMGATQNFSAAGGFASRSATLSSYANAILSTAASLANSAQTTSDTSGATYTYLSDKFTNMTGVNVDEETANMTSLQTNYEATAMLMSTIRDMFKTLIDVVGQ